MTMKYVNEVEEALSGLSCGVVEAGRQTWLAGMGAASVVANTTATVFDTLVEEGRRFQEKEIDAVGKAVKQVADKVGDVYGSAAHYVQSHVEQVSKQALNRFGVPARGDVADLTARVEMLTARVEMLNRKGAVHAG
jgi:poly(hydroxyalkanoate) granule-associated protein